MTWRSCFRALQGAVAVALLLLLWRIADGTAALAHLAQAHPAWLAAALSALTAQTVLSALRWRLTAGQLGIDLDRWTAVREYYLSQIVNQVLPGGVLGDAGRALRSRSQAGLLVSGQAVLFERVAGQIALLLLFASGVALTLAMPGAFRLPDWLMTPVLLALLIAGGGAVALAMAGRNAPSRFGRAIRDGRKAFLHATWAPEIRSRQASMSVGTAVCNVAAFACCAAAVGAALTPVMALVLVPLILFAMLVPVTVSGWGLREGAAVALLPLAGVTAPQSLATSVAFGLLILAAALPGVVVAGGVVGARRVSGWQFRNRGARDRKCGQHDSATRQEGRPTLEDMEPDGRPS
jgi:uncharacterized membrane protein YbhN (UPF0104 family)